METKIVTNIKTDVFYSIIKFLKNNNWKLTIEYDNQIFDKGVDFDFYQITKNNEQILFAWSNWFEGEIKAKTNILNEISQQFEIELEYGKPEYLDNMNIIEEMKPSLTFK